MEDFSAWETQEVGNELFSLSFNDDIIQGVNIGLQPPAWDYQTGFQEQDRVIRCKGKEIPDG